LLRLLLFSRQNIQRTLRHTESPRTPQISPNFSCHISSIAATGGVYKEKGLSHRCLLNNDYKKFLVYEASYKPQVPSLRHLQRLPTPVREGWKADARRESLTPRDKTKSTQPLFEAVSVARVRPRVSKGITDLLLPRTSFDLTSKNFEIFFTDLK